MKSVRNRRAPRERTAPAAGHVLPALALASCVLVLIGSLAAAQDPAPPAAPKEDLSQSQLQLLRDFERFEKSLYDVAEFSRRTDPEQAELLYRARSQSQEQRILDEMRVLADSLKPQAGGKVVIGDSPEKQAEVIARLQTLLKVLQSADERDRLQREIERIQDLLKGTNALIGKQRDVRSDTSRGGDQKQLSEREKKLIEEAQKLAQKIDQQDAESRGESPDSKPGEKPPQDPKEVDPKDGQPKPGEQKPGDEKSPDGKPHEGSSPMDPKPGEQKPGEPKTGEPGSPMEGDPKEPMEPKAGEKPAEQKPGEEKPGEQKPGEQKPGEQKPGEQKPGEQKPGEQKPGEQKPGEQRPGEQKPMDGQSPSDSPPGKPQDPPPPGQQQSGQPPKGQKPQELGEQKPGGQSPPQAGEDEPKDSKQTPGREELEEAREQMQRALEELDKQNREGSTEAQQQALAQLEKVKARLEEILRQLREEENELLLASLEARFQKLRKAQMQVNTETVRLAKTVAEDRSRHDDRAVALSRDQREIVVDAEKALSLLKEEGSSVAFPEAIEQMRDNMLTVAERLNGGDTGSTTQVIEDLIVETLDEMILAMQQEMEKAKDKDKDKQKQQQKQQQQEDDEQALINELAELKMIRSLQNQINRLTREIGRELDGEQASDPSLKKLTEDLSRRQKRLQDATYDLSTGKNR